MASKRVDDELVEDYRNYQNDLYLECFSDAKRILRKAGGDFPLERALDVANTLFQKRCAEWLTFRNEGRADTARLERFSAPAARR